MIQYCKKNLEEIKSLLQVLPKEHYTFPVAILSNATIGEHVRHILEFYKCLIDGIACDVVNYDERKRDKTCHQGRSALPDAAAGRCRQL